ncbi:MAG: aspartate--ammonia ligase, partial [Cyclobacteriaceae bacterium]|nr:aspartate--ammonia ligase [Cyclobacteriaceae bacterium]
MKNLFVPKNYKNLLDVNETEKAIKLVKETFQQNLAAELKLRRVTAPLFVLKGTGINDDLNGIERKVSFPIKDMDLAVAEVVNSLAKWKRIALARHEIKDSFGLYTDMNAVRPDEVLDNIHSLYVDQWDWERVMSEGERNLVFLQYVVEKIYEVLKRTEYVICEHYPQIKSQLPDEIKFIQTEDLLREFPKLTSKQREYEAAKKYGAIFLIGIGGALSTGEPHDGRAPDYDDWSSQTSDLYRGLNGDIIIWNDILQDSFEISSMGIRVNRAALQEQLKISNSEDRKAYDFHKMLLNDELPQSIGGGIGQSRICMYYLRKAHIGEVQSSIWSKETR